MSAWHTPDGHKVEPVTRSWARDGKNGQWLRVTGPKGHRVGQVRTPAELATLGINLAELEETAA
jgi:hypothetical protein